MVQRWILIAGAVLIILIGLFPPYVVVMPAVELNGKKYPEKVIAAGYGLIFDPPTGFDPDSFASVAQTPAGGNTPLESELLKIYKPSVPQGPERLQLVRIDVVRSWLTRSAPIPDHDPKGEVNLRPSALICGRILRVFAPLRLRV